MAVAALIVWIAVAVGGGIMTGIWFARGGAGAQQDATRFSVPVLFAHVGLAVIGLVLWIVYMILGDAAWAWLAFAALVLVALGGFVLFARWLPGYRARTSAVSGTGSGDAAAARQPAESHFPVALVAGHGIGAVATVVLVLLAALGL
ncbi:hypothetical protein [Haloechinothrix sp. LS1_15]|uniref:hypothetical protein n=1 Tax=Haloechinothrix sp. LS1_15 TaxID=2652248 RepID=UPI0029477360|nr:hypothetical protein [Haloechinothrix sp. LS1_15]MDV6011245.1 hypothetical protein [Haloechinothrix sp. LS1_15]